MGLIEIIRCWVSNPVDNIQIWGLRMFQIRRIVELLQFISGLGVLVEILGLEWFQKRGLVFFYQPLKFLRKISSLVGLALLQIKISSAWMGTVWYYFLKLLRVKEGDEMRKRSKLLLLETLKNSYCSSTLILISFIINEIIFIRIIGWNSSLDVINLILLTAINFLLLAPLSVLIISLPIPILFIGWANSIALGDLFLLTDNRLKMALTKMFFWIFLFSSILSILIA